MARGANTIHTAFHTDSLMQYFDVSARVLFTSSMIRWSLSVGRRHCTFPRETGQIPLLSHVRRWNSAASSTNHRGGRRCPEVVSKQICLKGYLSTKRDCRSQVPGGREDPWIHTYLTNVSRKLFDTRELTKVSLLAVNHHRHS